MTVPATPIPTVGALCRAAIGAAPSSWEPWRRPGTDRVVQFHSAGRFALDAGIAHALERRARGSAVVWLPEYICAEAVIPLRAGASTLHFYPVRRDLAPDWERIRVEASPVGPPDVFVLVHYFGFPNSVAEAKAFCSTSDAVLIEDCAHVLVPTIGCCDSTSVFSPRKLLPVPECGLLVLEEGTGARPSAPAFGNNKAFIMKWIARRLAQRLMLALGVSWHGSRKRGVAAPRDSRAEVPGEKVTLLPDAYSLRLLGVLKNDLDSVIQRRRANYLRLLEAVVGIEQLIPAFPVLPEQVCPYAFPLIVSSGRDALDRSLQRQGIPSSDWPNLPAEVTASPDEHRIAVWLQEHILLLPVHQSLGENQIERMASELKRLTTTKAA